MPRVRSAWIVTGVFVLAWALGVAGMVGGLSGGLLIPAGLLLIGVGATVLADAGAVRSGLHWIHRESTAQYPPRDHVTYWGFYGAAMILVGVGWAAGGVAQVT